MIISYIITGSVSIGMAIGGFEVFTKMILYYLHERAWYKYVNLGRGASEEVRRLVEPNNKDNSPTHTKPNPLTSQPPNP